MAKSEIKIIIKAVDEASGAIKNVDGSLSGLQKAGLAAGAALLAVGAALGAVAVKAGKFIVEAAKAAAEVEQLAGVNRILARNAGIADEVVRQQVKGLRSQGIEAAASEKAIARMMQAELDLSKATDLARVAQDAAVISLSNSTETYDRLIHGITTLNPLVLRTAGLTIDTSAAYDKYAAEIGKVASELTTQEKQQALLNAVLAEGVKIQGAYDESMKNPIKQLGSMTRLIDDLKVAIGEVFVEALSAVVFKLSEFVKWLTEAVSEGGQLRPVLELLAEYAELAAVKFGEMADAFMSNDFNQTAQDIKDLVDALKSLYEFLQMMATNIPIFMAVMYGDVGTYMRLTSQEVDKESSKMIGIFQRINDFQQRMVGVWQSRWEIMANSFSAAGQVIGRVASGIVSAINSVINAINRIPAINIPLIGGGGFQTGGSFIVPGHGSGDRPYTLGLEPGERVTVTPRNQAGSSRGGGGLSLVVHINTPVNLADRAYAERELLPYIEAGVRQIMARTA
jgi:hypothetical protein